MGKKSISMILPAAAAIAMALAGPPAEAAAADPSHHTLRVSVDVSTGTLQGTDTIVLGSGSGRVSLVLRSGSKVSRVEAAGRELGFEVSERTQGLSEISFELPGEAGRRFTVSFSGSFQSPMEAGRHIKRGVAYLSDGVIGAEGVLLPSSSYWFPQEAEGLMVFEAEVTLPPSYSSVMEGELARSERTEASTVELWRERKPVDGADLVAARYFVDKASHDGIEIYTFFFEKDEALSRTYIEKTKEHLDTYRSLIGPYPFGKFAVVESFMPTGYGMPSFTLLGSSVIRLPFIPDTSLGHEIAHNWLGNSVFVDASLGNWAEALTTYVADYLYERRKGPEAARQFRAAKLRGYRNYAAGSEATLSSFTDATTTSSRAVGYNKGLMLFNMLEQRLGEAAFKQGLQRLYKDKAFERASWADIRKAFEAASGQDLGPFFDQWLNRPGGPALAIAGAKASSKAGRHIVSLSLRQGSPVYDLDLPVLVKTASGHRWQTVRMSEAEQDFTIETDSEPLSVEIDPQMHNFRVLSDAEAPPTIAAILGDPSALIVMPNKSRHYEKYLPASDLLANDYGLQVVTDADIGRQDYLKDRSVLMLGGQSENRLYWLTSQHFAKHAGISGTEYKVEGKSFPKGGTALVLAVKNPHDPSKVLALLTTEAGKERVLEIAKRMRYFTDFSYLVFTDDGQVEKGLFEGEKPLMRTLK